MIRIAVTELDSYRYFKESDQEVDALLARLRKEEPPTRQMLAGKALHKILEKASAVLSEEVETATLDGFTFRFAADINLPRLPVCELKGELELLTTTGPVTLVGVVDGLDGVIYDHKLTERFDAEKYFDSLQWRAYLLMFGAQRFVYNIFETKEELEEWVVWGFHRFSLYNYAALESDVLREVSELAQFIATNLPERVTA